MRLLIHRSECSLHKGDHLIQSWFRYEFEPITAAFQTRNGFRKSRLASVAIAVSVPVSSRLERGRLVTFAGPLDATNVWHLARDGKRGFKLIEEESDVRRTDEYRLDGGGLGTNPAGTGRPA